MQPRVGLPLWVWVLALVPVLGLAALHVPFPLGGDQAMFVYGARELAEGARIYVDFWDMKQPGIFWFCQVAGSLFGFDAVGIHTAELFWQLALAAVLVPLAAWHLQQRSLACLAPLLCLGPYYASSQQQYLTVVEMLVNLPLTACLAALLWPQQQPGRVRLLHVGAGLMAAAVIVAKLMLVVVPIAMALAVFGWRLATRLDRPDDLVAQRALPMLAGLAVGLGLTAAYLAAQGALGAAAWAWLSYPPQAVATFPHKPIEQLGTAFGWLWGRTWPLVIVGTLALLPAGRRVRWPLLLALAAWLVAGAAAIALQVLSWWIYHMTLLLVPLGLAGLLGIDAAVTAARRLAGPIAGPIAGRALAATAVAAPLLLAVLLPLWLGLAYPLWKRAPWTAASVQEYQERVDPRLAALRVSAGFLESPEALPGRIALLGDMRILSHVQRRPVTAINGWTYYLPGQLDEVAATLERERPPYVYVSWYVAHILRNGNDSVFRVLERDYVRVADDGADGSWFRRAAR